MVSAQRRRRGSVNGGRQGGGTSGAVLRLFPAVVLAVALIAGCSAQGATLPSMPATVARVTSMTQVRLPWEGFEPSLSQEVAASKAVTLLAENCLRPYGLPSPSGLLGHITPPAPTITESAVQWLSAASAARYGFNPPPPPDVSSFQDALSGQSVIDYPSLYGVLYGRNPATGSRITRFNGRLVPQGGCLGHATDEVAAGIKPEALQGSANNLSLPGAAYYELVWPGLPVTLEEQAVTETENDPRAIAVASQWHTCMVGKGYSYATPLDATADSRWAPATTDAASRAKTVKEEIAVATADTNCQQQVNFAGTRLALMTVYERQLIGTHLAQLREYESDIARLMTNTQAILRSKRS